MAKAKKTTASKDSGARPPVEPPAAPLDRVGSVGLERAVGQVLARAAAGLVDRRALTEAARNLLGGTLSPQAALLALAQAGHDALSAAARQAQRAADQQALISRQLRDGLLQSASKATPVRPRRDDYVLRGKVVLADGAPAAGLAVAAADRDAARGDVLGAAITDAAGAFQIPFRKTAFADRGAGAPEIVLSVGREGEVPLHATRPARLFADASRQASVTITLPKGSDVPAGDDEASEADTSARLLRAAYVETVTRLQQQQFDELVRDVQDGLGALVTALRRQMDGDAKGGGAPRRQPK